MHVQGKNAAGTRRTISVAHVNDGTVQVAIWNSKGNIDGWAVYLDPDEARQLARDLRNAAYRVDGMAPNNPSITITVEGGVVQDVTGTDNYTILDLDNEPAQ